MSQTKKTPSAKNFLRSVTGSRLVLFFLLIVVLLLAISFFKGGDEALLLPRPEPTKTENAVSTQKREMPVYVLSADKSRLEQVSKQVEIHKETALSIKSLLNIYVGETKTAEELFPDGTVIRSVFVHADIVYISFDSSIRKKFNGGTRLELLALQAVAWSVIKNFEEINAAQFLVDDAPSDIFVSHVDISRPYRKPAPLEK